jgi:CheY-like chemotaxis protein
LWDAFEQADNSITRAHGGAGLGLAITKRIVELMGGSIEVESELGKGSRFICVIPVTAGSPPAGVDQETGANDAVAGGLKDLRILVVDDTEINREIVLALLEDTGASLDAAVNGEDAVNKFSQNPCDVVLMDLHMPVMDGFKAARRIRSLSGPDNVLIIAVTADTGSEVTARCREAGMDDHLGKPIDYEALLEKISRAAFARGRGLQNEIG